MKLKVVCAAATAVCMAFVTSGCELTMYDDEQHSVRSDITFSWWGKDIRNEYTVDAIKKFEEQNSDVTVMPEYAEFEGQKTKMDADILTGTEADVMQLNYDWLYEYSPNGDKFYNLDDLSAYIDLKNFSSSDLNYGRINGKLNGIPTSLNAVTFYYNENVYKNYKLSLPKTWNDLISAANVMKQDEVYPVMMSAKTAWLSACAYECQKTGIDIFDSDGKLVYTQDNLSDMLDFYVTLLRKKVTKTSDKFDKADFENCKAGGLSAWISDAEYFCTPLSKSGYSVKVGNYPSINGTDDYGWYIKPTSLYAIKKSTKSPAECAKLVNYLLNSEEMISRQKTEKGIPVSKSALEVLDAKDLLTGTQYTATKKMNSSGMKIMDSKLEKSEVIEAFISAADDIYYSKSDLKTASGSLYQKVNKAFGS